ncbi:baseplate assembly protein [Thiomicrorhabdus sp.]|uniref:baseplate assembly protein n=1 Tax=Thiomicrorhabdus sp. TaxID=2039724 RepID=UPI0029C66D76|nr:baseplate J/gp47 family protein [Thiomicrorhabdus sp.]
MCAYRELVLRNRINEAAKSVMLPYATGTDLDNLAAMFGLERLEGEADEALRYRAQLSMDGLSNAGTLGAYRYHALGASSDVQDVHIYHHSPGVVGVVVLSKTESGEAGTALLDKVSATLNADDVKALCDTLIIESAQIVPVDITVHLRILSGPDAALVVSQVQASIAQLKANLGLGNCLSLSAAYKAAHAEGVSSASLSLTNDVDINPNQRIDLTLSSLTFEVVNG